MFCKAIFYIKCLTQFIPILDISAARKFTMDARDKNPQVKIFRHEPLA
jgi:hypothetical protein